MEQHTSLLSRSPKKLPCWIFVREEVAEPVMEGALNPAVHSIFVTGWMQPCCDFAQTESERSTMGVYSAQVCERGSCPKMALQDALPGAQLSSFS